MVGGRLQPDYGGQVLLKHEDLQIATRVYSRWYANGEARLVKSLKLLSDPMRDCPVCGRTFRERLSDGALLAGCRRRVQKEGAEWRVQNGGFAQGGLPAILLLHACPRPPARMCPCSRLPALLCAQILPAALLLRTAKPATIYLHAPASSNA